VAERCLLKTIDRKLPEVNLISLKLRRIPNLENLAPELLHLLSVNLSKNQLFDGDLVFLALGHLPHLQQLNLSENFLNGMLSEHAGSLVNIEILNLDVNNITGLCPAVRNWTKLKTFTISDNSLTSLPLEASSWEEIQIINLKNNKIADVGTLPQFWPRLERFYLGSNLLSSIPFEIGTCVNLIELDLSQ
jgi:Leucine-rich repeat (LRR) protein